MSDSYVSFVSLQGSVLVSYITTLEWQQTFHQCTADISFLSLFFLVWELVWAHCLGSKSHLQEAWICGCEQHETRTFNLFSQHISLYTLKLLVLLQLRHLFWDRVRVLIWKNSVPLVWDCGWAIQFSCQLQPWMLSSKPWTSVAHQLTWYLSKVGRIIWSYLQQGLEQCFLLQLW